MHTPVDNSSDTISPLDTHHLRIAGAVVLSLILIIAAVGIIRAVVP